MAERLEKTERKLQRLVAAQVRGDVRSVVLGVRKLDGSATFLGAAGQAAKGRPMEVHTPFLLASISKLYTATLVFQLIEEGRLELDAPLGKLLPARLLDGLHVWRGQEVAEEITVAQLLTHTSGIPDYYADKPKGGTSLQQELHLGQDQEASIEQILERVRQLEPRFAPGAHQGRRAHYSDTNFRLLGMIVESLVENSLAATLHARIFEPLALTCTHPYGRQSQGVAPAERYFRGENLHRPRFLSSNLPEGGLVSTVDETLSFLSAFVSGRLFSTKWVGRGPFNGIFFPLKYGYAQMLFSLPVWMWPFPGGPDLLGHAGSTGSFAFWDRKKDLLIAGTINQGSSPPAAFRLMMRAASIF